MTGPFIVFCQEFDILFLMCYLSLQVDSLKEICEGMLLRDIDEDTVLLYVGLAEQFTVPRLKVRPTECLRVARVLCINYRVRQTNQTLYFL